MTSPTKDRRTRIAEAAIELLARHGARGLTHRAVDAELDLPGGSTSYYFPTRAALLLAAAERVVELDTADVQAISTDLEGVAALIMRWLSPARRTRALARVELLLTAARDPAFEFMQNARRSFMARVMNEGAASSEATATALVALIDGLLLHGLVLGEPSREHVRQALERFRPSAKRGR